MVHYVVQPGDSLRELSRRFHTTEDEIRAANGLASDTLYVGQPLRLPVPPTAPPPGRAYRYTVQPGDTLPSIALRFGTTVDQLMLDNRLVSGTIYPSQPLTVYTGAVVSAVPPSPDPRASVPQGQPMVQSLYQEEGDIQEDERVLLFQRIRILETQQEQMEQRLTKLEQRLSKARKTTTTTTTKTKATRPR